MPAIEMAEQKHPVFAGTFSDIAAGKLIKKLENEGRFTPYSDSHSDCLEVNGCLRRSEDHEQKD